MIGRYEQKYIDVAYDTVPYAANVSTRSQEPKWFENSASSAKSHRALNPVRNPLLRYFGTCYLVVNGLRARASECRLEVSTVKRVPIKAPTADATFPAISELGAQ
ncbi:hypothetical protein Bbelb_391690 [Branchiostoma belcheri]|nr:hypothetical protein Bbelb_391690 [Branchiostoma belcheri]